jgi:putative ABC transport system permease protein
MPFFSSYYTTYFLIMPRYGMIMFLAVFIGLVFLICTGSIIFFKQISEANEDKGSYSILKKIGVGRDQIKSSIAKQMLFIFSLPLLVGITHSIAALSILRPILTSNIIIPISITIIIYSLIYLFYYLLTVSSYYKIINNE